jgi:Ras-related C3 botulinum toxin substrate 1
MLTSYANKTVPKDHVATVFDNYSAQITVNGKLVNLNLADTAGQEDFESLRTLCYPGTNIYLCVFAVNDRQSFNNIESKWFPELQSKDKVKSSFGVPIIICGNKIDIRSKGEEIQNCVSTEEGEGLLRRMKSLYSNNTSNIHYMECSAMTWDGLKEIFDQAIKCHMSALHKKAKGKTQKCNIL